MLGDGPGLLEQGIVAVFSQRKYPAIVDRLAVIGDDEGKVGFVDHAESLAMRTGPVRRIEGKSVRRGFLIGNTGIRAHQFLAVVIQLTAVGIFHHDELLAGFQGLLHTFGNAETIVFIYPKAVYHYFNIVHLVTVHLHFR